MHRLYCFRIDASDECLCESDATWPWRLTEGSDSSVAPKLSPTPSQNSQLSVGLQFALSASVASSARLRWMRYVGSDSISELQMAENWRPWSTLNRRRLWWSCIDAHAFYWRSDDWHESGFATKKKARRVKCIFSSSFSDQSWKQSRLLVC